MCGRAAHRTITSQPASQSSANAYTSTYHVCSTTILFIIEPPSGTAAAILVWGCGSVTKHSERRRHSPNGMLLWKYECFVCFFFVVFFMCRWLAWWMCRVRRDTRIPCATEHSEYNSIESACTPSPNHAKHYSILIHPQICIFKIFFSSMARNHLFFFAFLLSLHKPVTFWRMVANFSQLLLLQLKVEVVPSDNVDAVWPTAQPNVFASIAQVTEHDVVRRCLCCFSFTLILPSECIQ